MNQALNHKPKISVLLCVHNGMPYLSAALASVFAQTFTDFELVVVDDASTDGTAETLSKIEDSRLLVLRNECNLGLTASLSRGLSACRAPLVARLDHDDVCDPLRLERQVDYLARNPQADVVATWSWLIDENNKRMGVWETPPELPAIVASLARAHNAINHSSVMFRRDVVLAAGGYGELIYAQDSDLWRRMLLQGSRIEMLPEHLMSYRVHRGQISSGNQPRQTAAARKVAVEFLRAVWPEATVERLQTFVTALSSGEGRNLDASEVEQIVVRLAERFGFHDNHAQVCRIRLTEMPAFFIHKGKCEADKPFAVAFSDDVVVTPDYVSVITWPGKEKYLVGARHGVRAQAHKGWEWLDAQTSAEARGEFVQLLGPDDLLPPDKWAKQIAFLRAHPEIDIVYGAASSFSYPLFGPLEKAHFVRAASEYSAALVANSLIPPAAALIRRRMFEAIDPPDISLGDLAVREFLLRAALRGYRFAFIPDDVLYHRGELSPSGTNDPQTRKAFIDRVESHLAERALTPAMAEALLYLHEVNLSTDQRNEKERTHRSDLLRTWRKDAAWPKEAESGLTVLERVHLLLHLARSYRKEKESIAEKLLAAAVEQLHIAEQTESDDPGIWVVDLVDHLHAMIDAEWTEWARRLWTTLCEWMAGNNPNELPRWRVALQVDEVLRPALNRLRELGCKRVAFYGSGLHTKRIFALLDLSDFEIVGIIDDNPDRWGQSLFGYPILSMTEAAARGTEAVIISSDRFERQMYSRCTSMLEAGIFVLRLYEKE